MGSLASVENSRLLSTERGREAIYRALRLFIGPDRAHSYDDVATALTAAGHTVQPKTVASWVAGSESDRRTPPSDVLMMLYQLLGTAFTSKVLNAVGQGAYSLTCAHGAPAEIIAALSDGTAQFAIRGIDGVFCNLDQGELESVADKMIEFLTPFSSKRSR